MAASRDKKNAWSFRANVICNPETMSFDPRDPHRSRDSPPSNAPARRCPPLRPRLHVFQRVDNSRDEHALKCYSKACKDHLQLKEKIKLQCKKSERELLMENLHLYRTRLENAELLNQAKGIEDCHNGEQLWAMSLREHWTVQPRIGDLYSTPINYSKKRSKVLEQIGSPIKENLHDLLLDFSTSNKNKDISTLATYKHFLEKCGEKFSKVGLHRPEFLGLEIIGTRLPLDLSAPTEKNSQPKESELVRSHENLDRNENMVEELDTLQSSAGSEEIKQCLCGPVAELDCWQLFLNCRPGENVNTKLTLQNKGSTILHYRLLNRTSGNILETLRKDRAGCFDIIPRSGFVEPGQAKQLFISFNPKFPGVFTGAWLLEFSPKLLTPLRPVNIVGMAVAEDRNRITRKHLEERLEIQQRNRGVREVLSVLIEKANDQGEVTFTKTIPDFVLSNESFDFLRSNESSETLLYYNPRLVQRFKEIANQLCDLRETNLAANFDHAFDPNYMCISMFAICMDTSSDTFHRDDWRQDVSNLVILMATSAHPSSVLHAAMYKAFCNAVNDIVEVVEKIKEFDATEIGENIDENFVDMQSFESGSATDSKLGEKNEPSESGTADYEDSDEVSETVENRTQNRAIHAVKVILQEMLQQFFSGIEDAVRRIEPLTQQIIQTHIANLDVESACWTSFSFLRLVHALAEA